MLYHICFLLAVVVVGGSHGLVKFHEALDPVDDDNGYIIAAEFSTDFEELEEKLSEFTSKNDTLEYKVLWKFPVGLKFLFVQMNKATLDAIREWEDDIIYIEEDGWLHLQSKETSGNDTKEETDKPKKKDGQPTEQWGLDRIDQRNVPLDGVFSVKPNAGSGQASTWSVPVSMSSMRTSVDEPATSMTIEERISTEEIAMDMERI
ncbi:uncharacterized protein LOC581790 [Strongylocentrotus purpuratus]|uniref:Uncharacterized protein n=1 Tax=Strongylocentrotus purpuratus TaxID=7668 RepID=A0A7M7NUD1_STRPU|nr:uncharacterized protein LOC581790 [Strongylocentrotus purpuratus]